MNTAQQKFSKDKKLILLSEFNPTKIVCLKDSIYCFSHLNEPSNDNKLNPLAV